MDERSYMHPFLGTLLLSCYKLPLSLVWTIITVSYLLFLPSVCPPCLLPELPGNLNHIISDIDPKMTLKRPPHLWVKVQISTVVYPTHQVQEVPFRLMSCSCYTHSGFQRFEPILVLDHVLHLPLAIPWHVTFCYLYLEIHCSSLKPQLKCQYLFEPSHDFFSIVELIF